MTPVRHYHNDRAYNDPWFDSLLDNVFNPAFCTAPLYTTPSMNILENEDLYRIEVAAPGMAKDDFKVSLDKDGNLLLNLEKKAEDKKEHGKYLRKDFSYTSFTRTLILPEDALRSDISAKVENGILTVEIPKVPKVSKENRNRAIEIA